MRGIFFGLLLANMLHFSWYYILAPLRVLREGSALDSSSLANSGAIEVALIAEVQESQLRYYPEVAQQSPPTTIASSEDVSDVVTGYCVEIGPFESAAQAQAAIDAFAVDVSMVTEQRTIPGNAEYRVYLPPFPNREIAAQTMQQIRDEFASRNLAIDTFLITRGELVNGIALGLFSEQRNASNVREQMRAMGYEVTVTEEARTVERFWIVSEPFDSKEDFEFRWAGIAALHDSAPAVEKLCQTIAQDTQFP